MTLREMNETIRSKSLLVSYFSHDDCNVCKALRPQVQQMVSDLEGMEFVYINAKESPHVSGQFMVFAVPTIIIFYEGREAKRYSRHLSLNDFRHFLHRLTNINKK